MGYVVKKFTAQNCIIPHEAHAANVPTAPAEVSIPSCSAAHSHRNSELAA